MGDPLHEELVLLLVDVQTAFLDAMVGDRARLETKLAKLVKLAALMDLPVVATLERPIESKGEPPDGLAPTARRIEKASFNAMAEPSLPAWLEETGRKAVAVAGAETDVCVLLTVEGLLAAGYRVHLLEDCVFSSTADVSAALGRMRQAGAVPTTLKTLAFELTGTVDRDAWPTAWRDALAADPSLFPEPDDLAPEL